MQLKLNGTLALDRMLSLAGYERRRIATEG